MVQARDRQRLARETLARFLRALQVRVHDLERDQAIETRVTRTVDGGHAAVPDFVDDLVLLEALEHSGPGRFPNDPGRPSLPPPRAGTQAIPKRPLSRR